MQPRRPRRVSRWARLVLLAVAMIAPACLPRDAKAAGDASTTAAWSKISRRALDAMASEGRATVIVRLRMESAVTTQIQALADRRRVVAKAQDRALTGLAAESGWKLHRRLETIPYLVGEVDYSAVGALAADPNVLSVQADQRVQPADVESNAQIGADMAQSKYGETGAGVNVGLIDTGIDLNHPDLSTAMIAGHRFLNQGAISDADVQDDQGHGTEVAAVITSDGYLAPLGVAPDAKLVVVKAMSKTGGWISDVVSGLDWIVTNNAGLSSPVRFVNLSLVVSGALPTQCPCSLSAYEALTDAIDTAAAHGVLCVAATGNDGASVLRYPACLSTVISVGSTFDQAYPYVPNAAGDYPTTGTFRATGGSTFADCNHVTPVVADQLACFSNRSTCMDFVAPGYCITTALLGSTTANINTYGTSLSAAQVTGVLALLQGAALGKSNAQLLALLHQTATKVPLDESLPTGSQADRVDILAAIKTARDSKADHWTLYR
jgi:subtilisin family serine protease